MALWIYSTNHSCCCFHHWFFVFCGCLQSNRQPFIYILYCINIQLIRMQINIYCIWTICWHFHIHMQPSRLYFLFFVSSTFSFFSWTIFDYLVSVFLCIFIFVLFNSHFVAFVHSHISKTFFHLNQEVPKSFDRMMKISDIKVNTKCNWINAFYLFLIIRKCIEQ